MAESQQDIKQQLDTERQLELARQLSAVESQLASDGKLSSELHNIVGTSVVDRRSSEWCLSQYQFFGKGPCATLKSFVHPYSSRKAHYRKKYKITAPFHFVEDPDAKEFLPFVITVPKNIIIPEGACIQLFQGKLPVPGSKDSKDNEFCEIIPQDKAKLVNRHWEQLIFIASDALLRSAPIVNTTTPGECVRCVRYPTDPDLAPGSYAVLLSPIFITIIKDGICTPIGSVEMPFRFPKDTSPEIMKHFTYSSDKKKVQEIRENTEKWIRENIKLVTPPAPGVKLHDCMQLVLGEFPLGTTPEKREALCNLFQRWTQNEFDDSTEISRSQKYPHWLIPYSKGLVFAYEAANKRHGPDYRISDCTLRDLESEIVPCKASL